MVKTSYFILLIFLLFFIGYYYSSCIEDFMPIIYDIRGYPNVVYKRYINGFLYPFAFLFTNNRYDIDGKYNSVKSKYYVI